MGFLNQFYWIVGFYGARVMEVNLIQSFIFASAIHEWPLLALRSDVNIECLAIMLELLISQEDYAAIHKLLNCSSVLGNQLP